MNTASKSFHLFPPYETFISLTKSLRFFNQDAGLSTQTTGEITIIALTTPICLLMVRINEPWHRNDYKNAKWKWGKHKITTDLPLKRGKGCRHFLKKNWQYIIVQTSLLISHRLLLKECCRHFDKSIIWSRCIQPTTHRLHAAWDS